MSHFVRVKDFQITSLSALESAASRIDCVFSEDTEARYYEGTKCVDYTIHVPNCEWDIAILKTDKLTENGDRIYNLEADFYGSNGKVLREKIEKLRQFYPIELAKEIANQEGYIVEEEIDSDGNINLDIYISEEL